MAGADYRRCDICGGKAFYDADLNYDFDKKDKDGNFKLGYVGSMKVLCDECSKTHMIVIVDCWVDNDLHKIEHGFICGPDKIVDLTQFRAKVWMEWHHYMGPVFYRSKSLIKQIQYPSKKTWDAFDKWQELNKEK